jgi:hypothetical protein
LFLSGFIALILGLLIVVSHNVWVLDWRLLITLFGWFGVIKGIIRITFTEFSVKHGEKLLKNDSSYYTAFGLNFILGLVLTFYGFLS